MTSVLRMTFCRRLQYYWITTAESEFILRPTVSRPVLSWNKSSIWGLRPDFYYCQLRVFWCGVLSLTRGRVCRLHLLLALDTAVFFGFSLTNPFITWCGPQTEHRLERFVCRNLRIRCQGNACLPQQPCVSKPLFRNGRSLRLHHSGFQAFWHTHCHGNVLSEALPSNTLFRLSGVMPQYVLHTLHEFRSYA
jgi:hypothetical protein